MATAQELVPLPQPSPERMDIDELASIFTPDEIQYIDSWQQSKIENGFLSYCTEGAVPPPFNADDTSWYERFTPFVRRSSVASEAVAELIEDDPVITLLQANLGSQHRYGATMPEAFRSRENVLVCKYYLMAQCLWPNLESGPSPQHEAVA